MLGTGQLFPVLFEREGRFQVQLRPGLPQRSQEPYSLQGGGRPRQPTFYQKTRYKKSGAGSFGNDEYSERYENGRGLGFRFSHGHDLLERQQRKEDLQVRATAIERFL